MNWDDKGYLLSKNRYNENSIIATVFTENYGKISGIIFGGTSKKIKNYLQVGNKIYVNYNSKSLTKIGWMTGSWRTWLDTYTPQRGARQPMSKYS